jgi:hypothetical protein
MVMIRILFDENYSMITAVPSCGRCRFIASFYLKLSRAVQDRPLRLKKLHRCEYQNRVCLANNRHDDETLAALSIFGQSTLAACSSA